MVTRLEDARYETTIFCDDEDEDIEAAFDECISSAYVVADMVELLYKAALDGSLKPINRSRHLRSV